MRDLPGRTSRPHHDLRGRAARRPDLRRAHERVPRLYHVLGGALSPLDGVEPEHLRIDELIGRVERNGVQEVVLATNPNMTGEATAALPRRPPARPRARHAARERAPRRRRPRVRGRSHTWPRAGRPQGDGVTTTEYEAVPAVARDEAAPRSDTVVMKFGGTSVADAEKLKHVARRLVAARENGARVVAVLSAMGSTTDELLELARQISARPEPRELDMLISVGERISCALAAMAIQDLGHEAISLTGSQAGIVTDTVHGEGEDRGRPREAN